MDYPVFSFYLGPSSGKLKYVLVHSMICQWLGVVLKACIITEGYNLKVILSTMAYYHGLFTQAISLTEFGDFNAKLQAVK